MGNHEEGQYPWRDRDRLEELYIDEQRTQREISEILGCGQDTIKRWLHRFDIPTRTDAGPAEMAEARRVNRVTYDTSRGYPRARSSNPNGGVDSVRIHRLLAISEYGAEKVSGNVVHHKNTIPWDNRPSNIEVMSRGEHSAHHNKERSSK
ncbi:HNH endonuclease [Halorubrum sp. SD626R]|uniref:HNH endonuclease n=1 Tax=Halorubrum sp. SD626R TaxID=1419722 RepID=UPI000B26AA69|nr:HNH endonuclease [Halorubrum sp. SD626R]